MQGDHSVIRIDRAASGVDRKRGGFLRADRTDGLQSAAVTELVMSDLFGGRHCAFLKGGPGLAAVQRYLEVLTGCRFIHLRGNDFEHCRPAQRRIQNRHDRSIRLHRIAAKDVGSSGLCAVYECNCVFACIVISADCIVN